jgi:hypothetical protein
VSFAFLGPEELTIKGPVRQSRNPRRYGTFTTKVAKSTKVKQNHV